MNNKSNNKTDSKSQFQVFEKINTKTKELFFNRNGLPADKVSDESPQVSYDNPSRWEMIEKNLRQGKEFLEEQDRQLKLAGMLLDNFRKALASFHEHGIGNVFQLHSQIFSCGIKDISSETYRGISLFGNNTQSPLKFHVYESGERKVVEVSRGDLSGPALQAIVYGKGQPPSKNLLLEATKEILELRALNSRQSNNLRHSYSKVLEKLEVLKNRRKSLLGKTNIFCSSYKNGNYATGSEEKSNRRVPVAKRLVDFFITSPMHKFTSFAHRR